MLRHISLQTVLQCQECKTATLRASRSIKRRLCGLDSKDRTFTVISLTGAALKVFSVENVRASHKVGTSVVVTNKVTGSYGDIDLIR